MIVPTTRIWLPPDIKDGEVSEYMDKVGEMKSAISSCARRQGELEIRTFEPALCACERTHRSINEWLTSPESGVGAQWYSGAGLSQAEE